MTIIFLTNLTDRQRVNRVKVTQKEISKVMGALGSRKTKAKAEASRRNGKKGGRPKTKVA